MLRIGRVLHVSPTNSKMVVIKAEKVPKTGDKIFDEERRPVGSVFDIFGPIVSPYVLAEVNLKKPQNLVDHIVYVSFPRRDVRMKGEKKR